MSRVRRFTRWLLPRLGLAFPLAIALGFFLYRWVVPEVVWQIYRTEMSHHTLVEPDIDDAAGAADMNYRVMTYDCGEGDIVLEGRAPEAKYWMLGLYDCRARAVPGGHLTHENVVTENGRFEVRITSEYTGEPNQLDCSSARRGMLMYRIISPDGELETPKVTVRQ